MSRKVRRQYLILGPLKMALVAANSTKYWSSFAQGSSRSLPTNDCLFKLSCLSISQLGKSRKLCRMFHSSNANTVCAPSPLHIVHCPFVNVLVAVTTWMPAPIRESVLRGSHNLPCLLRMHAQQKVSCYRTTSMLHVEYTHNQSKMSQIREWRRL